MNGRILILVVCLFADVLAAGPLRADQRPRLAVLTDIGGDPDDQQSMIRLMVYSNEFRLEALIASCAGTPGELRDAQPQPDLIRNIVSAYGRVRPQLMKYAEGWPEEQHLQNIIRTGSRRRGRKHVGPDGDTAGSRFLIERIDAGSPGDPLNISIWGGQTDFAQALWRVRQDRGGSGLAKFVQRLRVYDISDQDEIAEWMHAEFPGMFYILSDAGERDRRLSTYRGMYLTGDLSLTSREWVDTNIRGTGPLGALYPTKTWTAPNPHSCMKEGDTPSWFFFLPIGGNDPADPTKPGWGGQFVQAADGWYRDRFKVDGQAAEDPRTSVSRWRPAFQQDFARRMSWCRAQGD